METNRRVEKLEGSVLNVEVSTFEKVNKRNTHQTYNLIELLNMTKFKEVLESYRLNLKEGIKADKASLFPCMTPQAKFEDNNSNNGEWNKEKFTITKLLCIDIDKKDNLHIENFGDVKDQISKIENIAYVGYSCSGEGVFALMYCDYSGDADYKDYYKYIASLLLKFGIVADSSCDQLTKLRFIVYDDAPFIRHNPILYKLPFKTMTASQMAIDPQKEFQPKAHSNEHTTNEFDLWERYNKDHVDYYIIGLLGFDRVREDAVRIYFKRQGSDNSNSANMIKETNIFKTWSPNTVLEKEKGYPPTELLILYFNGDKSKAFKYLIDLYKG
jgi:hypothetical protein